MVAACNHSAPDSTQASAPEPRVDAGVGGKHEIRITGLVQAIHQIKIMVPQIQGQYSQLTLTNLIPNGTRVQEGDLVATFDPTLQMDSARDARAKFEDLSHQVEQKAAENRANAEKRGVDLRQAEGDLAKAELELQKGPVLSEIDRLQNEAKAQGARTRVASLRKSMAFRERAEAAALRVLELQRDRQKIALERAQTNIQKMEIHAPLAGILAHEITYRAGSLGKAQPGDQIYRGYPLASIFDPSSMEVRCSVNEPDILAVPVGSRASVHPDAYPDLALSARLVSASPVASSPLGTPIKTFLAVFSIDRPDPHLMPDLSVAVILARPGQPGESPTAAAQAPAGPR